METNGNNNVSNLEWATQIEQNKHFYKTNLKSKENIKKTIEAMNKANKKAVICIDLGIVFNSMAEAARYININASASLISRCCKGKRKTAYGYKWTYVA